MQCDARNLKRSLQRTDPTREPVSPTKQQHWTIPPASPGSICDICVFCSCVTFFFFSSHSLSRLKPKIWTFRSTRLSSYISDGHLSDTLNRKPPLFITSPLTSLSPPRPHRARAHRTPTFRRTHCLYSLLPPPFYLNVLTVIHGFFSLFFFFRRANAVYRVVWMCYVLASFPTFHFQFRSFTFCIFFFIFFSSFFGLAFAGCLGLGLLLAHYSLGLCLSSSAICCYHVSTSNCSSLHYYNPWDSLCQAYACNPPPCRLLSLC